MLIGSAKNAPTAIEDMPKDMMTSLGNQYPLKVVKAEPKPSESMTQKEGVTKPPVSETKPTVPKVPAATSTGKSSKPSTTTSSSTSITSVAPRQVDADGSTLEDR